MTVTVATDAFKSGDCRWSLLAIFASHSRLMQVATSFLVCADRDSVPVSCGSDPGQGLPIRTDIFVSELGAAPSSLACCELAI